MEYLNAAVDFFTQSLHIGKKIEDEEIMAESHANLGRLYFKVLKNNAKARNHLYEATKAVHK